MKIWEKTNTKNSNAVEKEWKKKIQSLQKSFEKDKLFTVRHNTNRIKRYASNRATIIMPPSAQNVSRETTTQNTSIQNAPTQALSEPILSTSTPLAPIEPTTVILEQMIQEVPEPDPTAPVLTNVIEYDPVTDDEYFSDENEGSLVLFPNTQENHLIQMMGQEFLSDEDTSTDENFQINHPFDRPRRLTRSQTQRQSDQKS